jgi:nucleoid-associated protein YgaU
MPLQLSDIDLYSDGFIINLPDGTQIIKRNKIPYTPNATRDRIHTITRGDRLDSITYKYYGNSKWWFLIADANEDIENPLDLSALVGKDIIIPDFDVIKSQR